MPLISMINYYMTISLVAILLFGVVLILRHQQRSLYRRFLVVMLMFWALIMLGMIYKFAEDGVVLHVNEGVANMQILLLGLPCFFTLISFPAAILNARLVKLRNWLLLTSPMILLLAAYFIWHAVSGADPFVQYSAAEFWQNISAPTIIMRLIIAFVFLLYVVVMQLTLWMVVPIYNSYIGENMADNSYNVDWVRMLIRYIVAVSIMYFIMTFTDSLYVNTLYLLSLVALFSFIVDRSLFYRTIDNLPPLALKWSRNDGWHVVDHPAFSVESELIPEVNLETLGDQIDIWMNETLNYTKVDFTTHDILEDFPSLTQEDLTKHFKLRGETFQSYVRRFRIKRACVIMETQDQEIYTKQLFGLVGFSHYSSFSRSFFAVMGLSPSDYIKQLKVLKKATKVL
ncbi:MAG: helix-turn-helix domain-containing protein [Rikenellaceae bacterium]